MHDICYSLGMVNLDHFNLDEDLNLLNRGRDIQLLTCSSNSETGKYKEENMVLKTV